MGELTEKQIKLLVSYAKQAEAETGCRLPEGAFMSLIRICRDYACVYNFKQYANRSGEVVEPPHDVDKELLEEIRRWRIRYFEYLTTSNGKLMHYRDY